MFQRIHTQPIAVPQQDHFVTNRIELGKFSIHDYEIAPSAALT